VRREHWIALVLVAGVVALVQNVRVYSSLGTGAGTGEVPSEEPLAESAAEDGEPADASAPVSDAVLEGYLATLAPGPGRNPFLTAAEAARQGGEGGVLSALPHLDGTLCGEARRVAWLDGHPVLEGDPVGAGRVARIEPGAVVLERGGESLRLEAGAGSPEPWEDLDAAD
jgi:hypothetical protein